MVASAWPRGRDARGRTHAGRLVAGQVARTRGTECNHYFNLPLLGDAFASTACRVQGESRQASTDSAHFASSHNAEEPTLSSKASVIASFEEFPIDKETRPAPIAT